jgi:hypothetical protein
MTSRTSPSNSAFSYFRIAREAIKRRARDARGHGAQPPSSVGEQLTSGVDLLCSSAHLPLKEFLGYLAQVAQGGCHRSAPCSRLRLPSLVETLTMTARTERDRHHKSSLSVILKIGRRHRRPALSL